MFHKYVTIQARRRLSGGEVVKLQMYGFVNLAKTEWIKRLQFRHIADASIRANSVL
jgi:hypothetical protein